MSRLVPFALALSCAAACTSSASDVPSAPPTETLTQGGVLVPHLVGIDRAQAEQLVEDRGLYVRVDARGSADTGRVVAQRPRPDVHVVEHSLIVLTVDCLPAPCPSPPAGTNIYDPCSCAYR